MRAAFLALWNDLQHGHEAAYDEWHSREHVPERVAVPGFRGGRRYGAPAHPAHRWFTLYDIADLGCLETPEYRDLLDNPTVESAAMRPRFRNVLRVPCEEVASAGFGAGGALAALRLPAAAEDAAAGMVPALAATPRIVRARLGRCAGGARADAQSADAAPFGAVLLVDALDRSMAAGAFANLVARFHPGEDPLHHGGLYDLAFIFPSADPAERGAHQRPPKPARVSQ